MATRPKRPGKWAEPPVAEGGRLATRPKRPGKWAEPPVAEGGRLALGLAVAGVTAGALLLVGGGPAGAVVPAGSAGGSAGGPAVGSTGPAPVDLGRLRGLDTAANAINSTGVVVGGSSGEPEVGHGFRWSGGTRTELPAGADNPAEIDDAGQIAGTTIGSRPNPGFVIRGGALVPLSFIVTGQGPSGDVVGRSDAGGVVHAQRWRAGTTTDLGTLGGGYSAAVAVNSHGVVIGESTTADGLLLGAVWSGSGGTAGGAGRWTALPVPAGAQAHPLAINGAGDIAGYTVDATGTSHPALWRGGRLTILGSGVGYAVAINDAGQIAGTYQNQAFRWAGGVLSPVPLAAGTHSSAAAINASGTVVGDAVAAGGGTRPFRWSATGVTQLAPLAGGGDASAQAVNDRGQVVGRASAPDGQHAALWN